MERLELLGQPLDLDLTLACGQAFRWRKRDDGVWWGVVGDKLVELKTHDDGVLWRTYPDHDLALVRDYLRLDDDVHAVYGELRSCDDHIAGLIERFHGLRLLRQEPLETLLSFVCSAANSIPRISRAIEELARQYGDLVCEKDNICYYAFPTMQRLISAERSALEDTESLAFRGANMQEVAAQLSRRGEDWLTSLRGVPYPEARTALTEIRGIGRKIADCVCLFSLDKHQAVPVDTHVRQLAVRLFMPDMKAKTITDAVYNRITDFFAKRYGRYAGWAQQFLFYEDLTRPRSSPHHSCHSECNEESRLKKQILRCAQNDAM